MQTGFVAIELSTEQAQFLTLCQKHYQNIKLMVQTGVFDLKCGRAILDFNESGQIKNIKKELDYHF